MQPRSPQAHLQLFRILLPLALLGALENLNIEIVTDINEQKAIADILFDMDAEITALEQKLAKCQKLKQGMMQQLLTGKIRLI